MKRFTLILLLLLMLFTHAIVSAQARTLFLIIVYQPVNSEYPENVGTGIDIRNIETLANQVSRDANLQLSIKKINTTLNPSTVRNDVFNYITSISVGTDDVVWYYYTGHGSNCDGFPKSAYGEICLSEVHQRIKSKNPRLTISMFDGCNVGDPIVEPNTDFLKTDVSNLRMLFLDARGDVKSCSSQSGKFSYGSQNAGGLYTIGFLQAIKEKNTWEEVFETCRTNTISLSQQNRRNQEPVSAISISYTTGTCSPSDFIVRVRENETIEMVSKRVYDNLIIEEPDINWGTLRQFTENVKLWNSGKNSIKKGDALDIRVSQYSLK